MACVESALPVSNSRKKTDELFLYWLSEPSTQELLRKELSKISGVPYSELDEKTVHETQSLVSEYANFLSPSSAVTNVLRPGSPNMRTPSPPLSHRSPKSPKGAGGRNRSPKKTLGKSPNHKLKGKNGLQQSFDEVDSSEDGFSDSGRVEVTEVLDLGAKQSQQQQQGRRSRSHSPKPDSLPMGPSPNHSSKHSGGNSSVHIPRFYFPNGRPQPGENLQERFAELTKFFENLDGGEANFKQFPQIMKVSVVYICSV